MEEVKNQKKEDKVVALVDSNNGSNAVVDVNKVNLLNPQERSQLELYLKSIIGTDKAGFKTIAEGIAIYNRAQDLNLPFTGCIEHIHVINGKTGIDIHLIKAMLSRAAVTWECIKDYTAQYEYTDGSNVYIETNLPDYCKKCKSQKEATECTDEDIVGVYPVRFYTDLKGNIYRAYQLNASFKQVSGVVEANAFIASGGKQIPVYRIPSQPVDYVTEYEFTRYKVIHGEKVIQKTKSHFSYSEALAAEFFKKDTYVKYARIMIGHRAFTLGARDIASDILFGCMETSELKIVSGKDLDDRDIIDISVEE
jgi:hypothetical protein|nr:MAG TPA: hypothetical protein [Crassvirales sp.]